MKAISMAKVVLLDLGEGNLQTGFPYIVAQLRQDGKDELRRFQGSLPAAPKLSELYRRWRLLYLALIQLQMHQQEAGMGVRLEVVEDDITNVSIIEFNEICKRLQLAFNAWLESREFMTGIDLQLRTVLDLQDEIHVIVLTQDQQLQQMPWHVWTFFEVFRNAEVALGLQTSQPSSAIFLPREQCRVLAILGDSHGIDIEGDRKELKALPQVETDICNEPHRLLLDQKLWDARVGIYYFLQVIAEPLKMAQRVSCRSIRIKS
jgi:hypothetical protein